MQFGHLLMASLSALAAAPCESMSQLKLADTTITSAKPVAAGSRAELNLPSGVPALPSFCRVQATIRPTTDSEIKIEVWMPDTNWNGKFMGVGNGGWAGRISFPALSTALRRLAQR